MENIKKIIIVFIIIAIILSIVILFLIQKDLKEIDSITENEINYEDYQGEYVTKDLPEKVTSKNVYYAVKEIITDYISYIGNQEVGKQALNEVFASSYKKEFNITEANIQENLSKFANSEIHIEDMYRLEKSGNISFIIVNGRIKSSSAKFNVLIKLDSLNKAYEIYPEEFINKYGYNNLEKIATLDVINSEDITPKQYNTLEFKNISNKEMCNFYLQDYIYNVTTNLENAYNLLDEEYRLKRFGSLEAYKTYINENINTIKNIELKEYTTLRYPDYKQYVCIDTAGNYYLFRETAIMEYTLLLDTYTVVLPEFVEKYNSLAVKEKVALNINNFIQAINDKNYNYAYGVLNETFKINNFGTQSNFENYAQNNFFEHNNVEFIEYSIENNTHIYTLKLNNEGRESINLTVIMSLGNSTDFTMSFSIN